MFIVRRAARAFTLVELLVVVAIIAVLVAILIPVLTKARDTAVTLSCLSNLKQMGVGVQMYANDNKGWCTPSIQEMAWPPLMGYWLTLSPTGPYQVPWQQSAAGYFVKKWDINKSDVMVWNCPAGPNPNGVFPTPGGFHGNYGINVEVGGTPLEFTTQPRANWKIKQLSGIHQPAERYLAFDAGEYALTQAQAKVPVLQRSYLPGNNPARTTMYPLTPFTGAYTGDSIFGRHRKKVNVVFADSHGETLTPKEMANNNIGWIGR